MGASRRGPLAPSRPTVSCLTQVSYEYWCYRAPQWSRNLLSTNHHGHLKRGLHARVVLTPSGGSTQLSHGDLFSSDHGGSLKGGFYSIAVHGSTNTRKTPASSKRPLDG